MGTQDVQGYAGYTLSKLYDWGKHGYTGHIEVYRLYSITRVNMAKQDI